MDIKLSDLSFEDSQRLIAEIQRQIMDRQWAVNTAMCLGSSLASGARDIESILRDAKSLLAFVTRPVSLPEDPR